MSNFSAEELVLLDRAVKTLDESHDVSCAVLKRHSARCDCFTSARINDFLLRLGTTREAVAAAALEARGSGS